MLSKGKAKFIKSLQLKKNREGSGSFVVEGRKSVLELAGSEFEIQTLVCSETFWRENRDRFKTRKLEVCLADPPSIGAVSSLEANESVLAVAKMGSPPLPRKPRGLIFALDGIRDPGNLGALLRIADWYGVAAVFASEESVDSYNPKVIQASMGSFCRLPVHRVNLETVLPALEVPLYAAATGGRAVHRFPFPKDCVLILGNESRGVSPSLSSRVRDRIGIPGYGKAESLNVVAAAAVLCDNYRRIVYQR